MKTEFIVRKYLASLMLVFLTACSEHSGHNISLHKGDYRFDGGIGEFFDCESRKKYFISRAGIFEQLQEEYSSLGLKEKDDAYILVEGYVKSEPLLGGMDPENVFVATKLVNIDAARGCQLKQ